MTRADDHEARTRLGKTAQLLVDCREALRRVSHDTQWAPAAGSGAEFIAGQLDGLPKAPSGRDHSAAVGDVITTYLVTAGEHCGALAALYREVEVAVSAASVARSVIESSARAMWVIGEIGEIGDPLTYGPEVLWRAMLEENLSAEQATQAAQRMGRKTNPIVIRQKAALRQVRADTAALLDGTTTMSDVADRGQLNGQVRASPSRAVGWMFDLLSRIGGGNINERQAAGVYDFLSSSTHPTLYPLRLARRWVEHDGHMHGDIVLDIAHLQRVAQAAIVAFYDVLGYAISFYGVDRAGHDWLTTQIDAAIPSIFGAAPAGVAGAPQADG